jgi:hypothetical protein
MGTDRSEIWISDLKHLPSRFRGSLEFWLLSVVSALSVVFTADYTDGRGWGFEILDFRSKHLPSRFSGSLEFCFIRGIRVIRGFLPRITRMARMGFDLGFQI